MEYIGSLGAGEGDGCFLCRYRDQADRDEANLVLWRGRRSMVVLNRFPYAGGHCMVAPLEHVGDISSLDTAALTEIMRMAGDLQLVLARAIGAQGFNIGINIGRCAGAGLPGHLHMHVVPRWPGDTNFMSVLGAVRVIPQTLEQLYTQLRAASAEMNLPGPGDCPER
jgi:ATP adenylyltransferase